MTPKPFSVLWLIELRNVLKKHKEYQLADTIRSILEEDGYILEDRKNCTYVKTNENQKHS